MILFFHKGKPNKFSTDNQIHCANYSKNQEMEMRSRYKSAPFTQVYCICKYIVAIKEILLQSRVKNNQEIPESSHLYGNDGHNILMPCYMF